MTFLIMNKKINWLTFIGIAVVCALLSACSDKSKEIVTDGNAVYYWRTTFRLNDYERSFMKKHDVKKMYVKFFDVSKKWDGDVIPVGTTIFIDSIPSDIMIVPTIFITSDAIADYPQFIDKLYTRVADMAEVNGISFGEIQIDCDWTESTSEQYFAFMKQFKEMLEPKGIGLSTTIRLFQLGYETPEADYGVLMCYNTGDIRTWETENSILDIKDMEQYLGKLSKCDLPLSVAFPNFSWDVSFDEEKNMMGIEYEKFDFTNKERFKKISDNRYELIPDDNDTYWTPRYVRHEEVGIDKILEAKDLIQKRMASSPLQNVMYHLDSVNLSKFTDDDVEKIYR